MAFSKTSTVPTIVSAPERGGLLCLKAALLNLRAIRGARKCSAGKPVVSMSYKSFNAAIKTTFKIAFSAEPLGISSHSLRRGGASTMLACGVPEAVIMQMGRWTSRAWRDYIDLSAEQQLFVLRSLQLISSLA